MATHFQKPYSTGCCGSKIIQGASGRRPQWLRTEVEKTRDGDRGDLSYVRASWAGFP